MAPSINDTPNGAFRWTNGSEIWLWITSGAPAGNGWYRQTPTGYDPAVRRDFNYFPANQIYGVAGTGYAGITVNADGTLNVPPGVQAFAVDGGIGFRAAPAMAPPGLGGGGGVGFNNNMNGSNNMQNNGNNFSSSTQQALARILQLQQTQAALAPISAQAVSAMQEAADEVDAGKGILLFGQGLLAAVTGNTQPTGTSLNAVLLSIIGTNGLTTLVSALTTLNTAAATAASQAAVNTAWNTFKTSAIAAFQAQQNNGLIAQLASGNGNVGQGALFGVLLSQQATTALTTAIATQIGATLPNLQADFPTVSTAITAWMSSQVINAMIPALAGGN